MDWFKRRPDAFTLTFVELPDTVVVKTNDTLLQAALSSGIEFPHLCRVGSCGSCKSKLVSGSTKSLVDLSYVLSPEEIRLGYILPCQSLARSDCKLSVPALNATLNEYLDIDAIKWPDIDCDSKL